MSKHYCLCYFTVVLTCNLKSDNVILPELLMSASFSLDVCIVNKQIILWRTHIIAFMWRPGTSIQELVLKLLYVLRTELKLSVLHSRHHLESVSADYVYEFLNGLHGSGHQISYVEKGAIVNFMEIILHITFINWFL